jgi:hypothetical protein
VHPKLAAAVGAVVGAFLMPSTWLLLVALTAGRAAFDTLRGAGDPAPAADPFEGIPNPDPSTVAPSSDAGMPGWLVALLAVAAVVTILAALFFGWVGHTLATNRQRARTADAMT